jgi:MSHA pilin protein MshA
MLKKKLKNQEGFTLIEIIAVLVILGILAAIAVPKYLDLQNQSKVAAARGFVAAAQSAISMGYASTLLGNTTTGGPAGDCTRVTIDVPSGVTASLSCPQTTYVNTQIAANYDDQQATGNWTTP